MSVKQEELSASQTLLDQEAKLKAAKDTQIKALLKERVDLAESTGIRLKSITEELKALGYHTPRTKTQTARTSPTQVIAEIGSSGQK